MSFISELERLKEKATKGPWRRAGSSLQGDTDYWLDVCEYIQSHDAEFIAFMCNHADEIAELVKLAQRSTNHFECDDGWYSCPKSESGCADDRQKGCTCGADDFINVLAALNKEKP